MAAIIEPRRMPNRPAPRPALRLVTAHDGRVVDAPVDLGITPLHLAAAVAAILVAMVLALAIGNGALAGLAPGPEAAASSTAEASAAPAGEPVTVRAGDTLWSIARRIQPTGDVRPLVDQLVATYGSVPLQPGQELIVPR
ncbi:LysM peptidoglycan-binding domain-containing protein [Aquihabitans daechungensis]|uniref:LysM peptidoglycan-binding domain-containing protein n=1 Tax=Aquihabitans daechungensis TaxID=1052257 RepID=UPI003BA37079